MNEQTGKGPDMVTLNAPGADAAAIGMAQDALDAFAEGLDGRLAGFAAVELAAKIANAALSYTVQPEITLDVDGALSFDLRTSAGHLILAELSLEGDLDASIYDQQDKLVRRMPSATGAELIAWFRG